METHPMLHPTSDAPSHAPSKRPALLLCALMVFWIACSTFVPRQGWDSSLGPVVPHDTFPADCSLCHTGSDWHTMRADFAFDHAAKTGVPLNGAHATVTCLSCHNDRGPVKQFAAQGCAGCHADPHRTQLGRNCKDCHDERNWRPSEMIARHDRTRFPLIGAHAATACFRCHPGAQVGNFAGASSECDDCHAGQYSRAAYDHVSTGNTQDCQRCHRPLGWLPAQVQHPASFPLRAGHAGRRCTECHTTPGTYTGLSTACVSCHLDDYQRTTNPSHVTYNFPQTCEQCHNTSSWGNGSFDHSWFPITSGAHRGFQCNQCHTQQIGLQFSCTHCHQHGQSVMSSAHRGVSGYTWTSNACYQCHPNGRAGGGGDSLRLRR